MLFFGDATYDYKNITNTEVNFIPVWESEESLNLVSSYCSDDYFGEFNDSKKTGLLSVALGRLPVKTIEEANAVVQKIISYSSSENAYGSWRNDFCCIADDEDGNLHFLQSEQISELVDTTDQNFNISKIYLDAYEQISDTNGQFYPDVNQVITNRINTGVSIINYIGHGFYNGLAHEKILTENDIDNWENFNFYPLMFTATCEFGRFDDPDRYGLAEKAILLQGKGMAAIIAPSRATYSNGNSDFQNNFYSVLLNQTETTLGKAVQFAKQQTGGYENARKYFLFGDPSMKLAIPAYTIVTEAINGMSVANPLDTIHPGEPVIVSGFITDISGEPVYNFNGPMEVRVFDRKDTLYTLANDPVSSVAEFTVRDSILVTLNTDILNGQFAFSFNMPYNINDEYGTVKFSYYAIDYPEDASGQFSGLVAGGIYNAISENVSVVDNIAVYPTIVASELWCLAKQDISDLKLDIYDPGGRKILSVSEKNMTAGSRRSIDVTVLNPGLYIVRLNADNRFTPFKIIKR